MPLPRPPLTCRMLSPAEFLALSPSAEAFPTFMKDFRHGPNTQVFCAFAGEELVGITKLTVLASNTNIEFLETSASSRNRGVAKEMMRQLFEHAEQNGAALTNQGFTGDGQDYLLRELAKLESEFPGRFHHVSSM
jgi:ribosomal protein S18 acetylase RimI-like enzyme